MTRYNPHSHTSSEVIKSELKARVAAQIDELFAQVPDHSSVAEIEKVLLKESPKLTSEVFQALVDRQDFSPSSRTRKTSKAARQRTQKKQG
jgi:hypothetical protein